MAAFFGSTAATNRLMLSREFYGTFSHYSYILIYQLDALVLSDQLVQWCETGLDYVGAPWLKCEVTPWVNEPAVGNGGFSLRKVPSFLEVLSSNKYSVDPETYFVAAYFYPPRGGQ